MSGIKVGDLVIVVKPTPCCGNYRSVGRIYKVARIVSGNRRCNFCAAISTHAFALQPNRYGIHLYRLKKLDPPATGEYDRVPVRKNLPRKETA